MKTTATVVLEGTLAEKVEERTQKLGASRNSVIREALAHYFGI